MSRSYREHLEKSPEKIRFAIVTCSSSRSGIASTGVTVSDESGDLAAELISEAGFQLCFRKLVPDDIIAIRRALTEAVSLGADIIVFIGGTGLSSKDVTVESVRPMVEKEIPGFGELFRKLGFEDLSSGTILSRAFAGVVGESVVFAIPGSPNATVLALKELIIPQARHIILHVKE